MTQITFYNAHHCPGAAMVLIEIFHQNGTRGKAHLHTGDMRFHEQMLRYPRLNLVAEERRLDTIWLDTTYALATRKHSFPSQTEAIDETARQVQEVLNQHATNSTEEQVEERVEMEEDGKPRTRHDSKTLVLLCCYNIGKEKILWRVAHITNRKLYAYPKKLRMLELCCRGRAVDREQEDSEVWHDNFQRYCTSKYKVTNIHVIPMHLAGKMWPFFQPNYQACAKYAMEHRPSSSSATEDFFYDKVVVFCPTGWAAANNWNRKNSTLVCSQTKIPEEVRMAVSASAVPTSIHVEIRLLPYSEHSSIAELKALVNDHWKPRKIIPTVYKTEAEKRQILSLFSVDHNRAKQQFLQSMTSPSRRANHSTLSAQKPPKNSPSSNAEIQASQPLISNIHPKRIELPAQRGTSNEPLHARGTNTVTILDDDENESNNHSDNTSEDILVSMGFSRSDVKQALKLVPSKSSKDGKLDSSSLDAALNHLVSSGTEQGRQAVGVKNLKRKRTQQTSLDVFVQRKAK